MRTHGTTCSNVSIIALVAIISLLLVLDHHVGRNVVIVNGQSVDNDGDDGGGMGFKVRLKRYFGIERFIYHDGLFRWFVEHPAPATETNDKLPLLIILHFGTGNMRSSQVLGRIIEKDPWLRLAERDGYLVLSPNAAVRRTRWIEGFITHNILLRDSNWNDLMGGRNNDTAAVDDVGFITALVDWAIENRNVDRQRIYITGISNGGSMVQRMIIERPGIFASASSFSITLPDRDIPFPANGIPYFFMSGTADNRIPYEGGVTSTRGPVRSVEATRDYFVAMNQAGPMVEQMLPDIDPNDNCTIVSNYFPHPTTPVQFYKLNGGGHIIPGPKTFAGLKIPNFVLNLLENVLGNVCYDVDGIALAWEFMTNFTLPPQ